MHAVHTCAALALLLSATAALAQAPDAASVASCPNVAGAWVSDPAGRAMTLHQAGCQISSDDFDDGGWTTSVAGAWNGYEFTWTATRISAAGCSNQLFGSAALTGTDSLHALTMRSSGTCKVPLEYGEARDWKRR